MSEQQMREAFEKVFPMPPECMWCGHGYAAKEYNAWDAHNYCERWLGWRAALSQPAPQGVAEYPAGEVIGPCVCGSWPGGECFNCPKVERQGAQEPVAWMTPGGDVTRSKRLAEERSSLHFGQPRPTPLYNHPSPSLAALRAKVEALAGTAGTDLLYRRDVLAEIDKLGGGV